METVAYIVKDAEKINCSVVLTTRDIHCVVMEKYLKQVYDANSEEIFRELSIKKLPASANWSWEWAGLHGIFYRADLVV